MEKEIRRLIQISSIISGILITLIVVLSFSLYTTFFFQSSRVSIYLLAAASVLVLILWAVSLGIISADKSGKAEGFNIYLLRMGISVLLPVYIYLTGLFGGEKDYIRRIYVKINNLVAGYRLHKKHLSQMLVLLPYCMQNKDCSCKVAEDIGNCRRCGGCIIGEVAGITERCGIRTVVAKGGTAARNAVKESNPDFILAIACERELLSGIGDVGSIPVIGLVNQRPNGYCTNTTVDIPQLQAILQELPGTGCEVRDTRPEDSSAGYESISGSARHVVHSTRHKII